MSNMITKIIFVMIVTVFAPGVQAATQYWDTATSTGLQGGTGEWNTTVLNWSDSSTGTALSAWVPDNIAAFAVPSNGFPSVVTVSQQFNVGRITNAGGSYLLIVTNGGGLLQGSGPSMIGANSSNNTVLVRGGAAGVSTWELGTFVSPRVLTIGSGSGTNNVLCIDGAGSAAKALVTNVFSVSVGSGAGSGWNVLIVTNGGRLYSGAGTIGVSSSSNNTAIVSGNGALWDGGWLILSLGGGAGTICNNTLIIDGQGVAGGAVVTNVGTVIINALGGTTGLGNNLIVTNGGMLTCSNLYAGQIAGSNATVVISGGAIPTLVNLKRNLNCGFSSGAQYFTMTIDGGGVVSGAVVNALGVLVGSAGGADYNTLIVTNKGVVTEILGSSVEGIGSSSVGNTMILAQGGIARLNLIGSGGYFVGYNASRSNSLVVTDPGSVLDLTGTYNIGVGGGANGSYGNTLQVGNYGVVTNAGISIPYNNTICHGNGLRITTNGQFYANRHCYIGGATAVTGNFAQVVGPGALWELGGNTLHIGGPTATNNYLTIDQGGVVDNVGTLSNYLNNSVNLLGGTLGVTNFSVSNGAPVFVVGDGVQVATLKGLGGGLNLTNGVLIASNGTLMGRGTVRAGPVGVILTNGATVSPGVARPNLTLTLSSLTWHGGGINLLEITNFTQTAGIGWDLLNVSDLVTLTNSSPPLVVKLDTLGAPAANFSSSADYNLRFLNYGSLVGFSSSQIVVDTNGFLNPFTGVWGITNANNALYVTYRGSGISYSPSSKWNDPNAGNWSDPNNWAPVGQPVNDGSADLEFSGNGTAYAATNDLGTFALNQLLLTAFGSAAVTNIIAGDTLVFTNEGARVDYSGVGSYLISSLIQFKTNMVFSGTGMGGSLVLSSNISAAGGLTKQGSWTLTLSGSNEFGGPVVVNSQDGLLRVETTNSLGRLNDVIVSNGTLSIVTPTDGIFARYGCPNRRGLVTGSGSLWTNKPGSGSFMIAQASTTQTTNVVLTVTDGGTFMVGGPIIVGYSCPRNSLIVSNGGRFVASGVNSYIGNSSAGINNTLLITGSNSSGNVASMYVGGSGGGNQLIVDQGGQFNSSAGIWVQNGAGTSYIIVTNGAQCQISDITLANSSVAGTIGKVVVTGTNSLLRLNNNSSLVKYGTSGSSITVDDNGVITNVNWTIAYGPAGKDNGIVVTNGGRMFCNGSSQIATTNNCTNNYIVVSGANSLWNNGGRNIFLASWRNSISNNVVIKDGGMMTNVAMICLATTNAISSSNNFVLVDGGILRAARLVCSNDSPNTVTLNGNCSVTLGTLIMTNAGQILQFNGGTLNVSATLMSNGTAQVVGDGTQSAILALLPGATTTFADGLTITNSAKLAGSGLNEAATTVYGELTPGIAGIGAITNSGNFTFKSGAVATFEITTNAASGTNWDFLLVTNGTLTLNGALRPVLTGGKIPVVSESYVIMTNSVPLSGTFENLSEGRVAVTTNNSPNTFGYFRVVIGSQYVALDNFWILSRGTIFTMR